MSYYKTCTRCGAHLDAGERCDCRSHHRTAPEIAKPTQRTPDDILAAAMYSALTDENKRLVGRKIAALLAEQGQASA